MRIGKYELLQRLGAGGMAEVWRAAAHGAGGFEKQVALKLLLESCASDAGLTQMLADEARLSASLDHPNIVATLDFGFADDRYYIAMELVDGLPLSACLGELRRRGRKLDLDLALHLMAEVLSALEHAHAAGIVHRDVNPSNVMLSRHGEVKLADFGIAKASGRRTRTEAGALKGKFAYMAPEQAWGRPLDARADVYAAGLTLVELVSGERAIDADSEMEVLERARAGQIRALPGGLPPPLVDAVSRALAADPAARFATAGALREPLQGCLAQLPPRDRRAAVGAWVAGILGGDGGVRASGSRGTPGPVVPGPGTRLTVAASPPAARGRALALAALAVAAGGAGIVLYPTRDAPPPPAAAAVPHRPAPPSEMPAPSAAPPARVRPPVAARRPGSGDPATLRIQVLPWGNVWVDDKAVGTTPLPPLRIKAGRHVLRAEHPALGSRRVQVDLRPSEARLETIDLSARLSAKKAGQP